MARKLRAWRPALRDLVLRAGARIPQRVPRPWLVAEIGVYDGFEASYLLREIPNLHIIMVDPWEAIPEYMAPFGVRWKQREFDRLYEAARAATEFAACRRTIVRTRSLDMVHTIADNSLHLAFLDGDKRKEVLAPEILAWWPKILPGGILCGHDWGSEPDVAPVVTAWAKDRLQITPGRSRIWYVEKAL
jgi:predicted O-methyltransferase YrrM